MSDSIGQEIGHQVQRLLRLRLILMLVLLAALSAGAYATFELLLRVPRTLADGIDGLGPLLDRLHGFAALGEILYLAMLLAVYRLVFRPLMAGTDRALTRLADLEDHHRAVIDGLAEGVLVIDPESRRVESMNPAARALFGHCDSAGPPALAELIPAAGRRSLAELRDWQGEEVLGQTAQRGKLYVDVAFRVARANDGERLVAVVRDITRRVEAEETAYTLSRALEQSPASALITDAEGVIRYANPRVCEISGYGRDELIGATPRLLKSGLTPPAVYAELWGELAAGRGWMGELLNRKKNGELYWNSLVISPLRNRAGEVTQYVAVMEDITQRKAMEQALMEAKQQAEQASRAKSDFLASMSHELRTPLNAVIGFSEFMQGQPLGPLGHAKYGEYLGHIHESGLHLLELINDMLDLAKVESGKLELDESVVDLAACIESALRLVSERAERGGIAVRRDLPADLPPLWADSLRLKQMVLNLLINAIKFTAGGGAVGVAAHVGPDGLAIVVEDSGVGIAPEDIPKVLEPFGQVANPLVRRGEGTGLGLPITRQLVEMHGGSLTLESRLGHGTRATLRLPAWRLRPVEG